MVSHLDAVRRVKNNKRLPWRLRPEFIAELARRGHTPEEGHDFGKCMTCQGLRKGLWFSGQKLRAIEAKGGRCVDCGFDFDGRPECAQLDHREGRVTRERYGRSVAHVGWKRLAEELELCDLVCANCHATRSRRRSRAI